MYQTMQQIYKWELWLYLKVGQPAIGELTCHYTRYPCHLAFALFRKGSLFWGLFWPFWALLGPYLYFRVPIFSVLARLTQKMSIQSVWMQQWVNLSCAVLKNHLLLEMVSTFVGTGSVLSGWLILIFTSSCASDFVNHPFGSLFWLPKVPIGSLFHKKLGPY